jgi:ubiquinone/menaquinone biosynthesis C-methylase UbiE
MAEGLIRAWWDRLRGRLRPTPCPFSQAAALDVSARRLVASPGRILGEFGLASGERVLEIGPGIGFYSVEAAKRVGTAGRLICLDLQREMLREVRRRTGAAGERRVDFVTADAGELPLRSGSIDRVSLITVLGEFPDRGRALAEIRRVLRPGGHLSVSEQLPDPDFVTRTTLRRELGAIGLIEVSGRGRFFYTSNWQLPE